MKLLRFLPILILLLVGEVIPSYAAQTTSCSFNSQLLFDGARWQVKSTMGPVYLARREEGAWRVLAVFDGTNGKYHLDWKNPTTGEYAALDSAGACSESFRIVDDRARSAGDPIASSTRSYSQPAQPNQDSSAFRRRVVAMMGKP